MLAAALLSPWSGIAQTRQQQELAVLRSFLLDTDFDWIDNGRLLGTITFHADGTAAQNWINVEHTWKFDAGQDLVIHSDGTRWVTRLKYRVETRSFEGTRDKTSQVQDNIRTVLKPHECDAHGLQELVETKQYLQFSGSLTRCTGLSNGQRNYFDGVLANRRNQLADSRTRIEKTLSTPGAGLSINQMKEAFETLATDDARSFRYQAALDDYRRMLHVVGPQMTDAEVALAEAHLHRYELLRSFPPQTVEIAADFAVQTRINPVHQQEAPVEIGGKREFAVLDTRGSYCVMSRSMAARFGLVPIEGTMTSQGMSGASFQVQPALIKSLRIGKAELKNVIALITDDPLFTSQYQTPFVLGYPVIAALGATTFSRDGVLTVKREETPDNEGTSLWIDSGLPLVAAATFPVFRGDALLGGDGPRLFALDTGDGFSYFTDKYYADHRNVFAGQPVEKALLAGFGGASEFPALKYTRPVPLWFGSTLVLYDRSYVFTEAIPANWGTFYGKLGMNLLLSSPSFTVDFRSMRMLVAPH